MQAEGLAFPIGRFFLLLRLFTFLQKGRWDRAKVLSYLGEGIKKGGRTPFCQRRESFISLALLASLR